MRTKKRLQNIEAAICSLEKARENHWKKLFNLRLRHEALEEDFKNLKKRWATFMESADGKNP